MNPSATTIFKRINSLEQEVQRLKVQAYFNLTKKGQQLEVYPESAVLKSLKATRKQIWQQRYAKKIKSLS